MNDQSSQPRVVGVEPLDRVDRKWMAKSEELELNALPTIRGAAEKWAASLTGILGAVGVAALLDGAKEFDGVRDPEQTIGKLVFFAAVLSALWATKHAIQAAQMATPRVFLPGGSALRSASGTAVESAVKHLKSSRTFAAVAVVLVLLAAAVVWWGRGTDSKPTVIEIRGSTLCENGGGQRGKPDESAKYVLQCSTP
jgi:hypothetical protein